MYKVFGQLAGFNLVRMALKIPWAHKCSNQQPVGLVSMADQINIWGQPM